MNINADKNKKDYRVCSECGEEFIPVFKEQTECSYVCSIIRATGGGGPDQF